MIPKASDALHGFIPDKLNDYFTSIAISPDEDPAESLNISEAASSDGFSFSPVSEAEVILAVSHSRTQAKGKNGIPQGIVAKALPIISPFLIRLFNSSLANGVFPPWKKARVIVLKKVPVPSSTFG